MVVAVGQQVVGPQHPQVLEPKTGELVDDSPHKGDGAVVLLDFPRPPLDLGAKLVKGCEIRPVVVREGSQDLVFDSLLFLVALTFGTGAKHALYGRAPGNQQQPELSAKEQEEICRVESQ